MGFSSFIYFKRKMSPHCNYRVQLSDHTYSPLAGMLARRQLSWVKCRLCLTCLTDISCVLLNLRDEKLLLIHLTTLLLWGIWLLQSCTDISARSDGLLPFTQFLRKVFWFIALQSTFPASVMFAFVFRAICNLEIWSDHCVTFNLDTDFKCLPPGWTQ